MKPGFTLIELLFVLVFSSMIISSLFLVFFQVNRASLIAQDVIDLDTRFSILNNQLQKDLSGVFVPIRAQLLQKEEQKKDGTAKPVKKEEIKPLKDVFLSSNKGELLSELTFITNNPVRVYEHAKNSEVKPRMVRVFYRLTPDKKQEGMFVLTRQEGTELDSSRYKPGGAKPIKGYEIANNIKSITAQYSVPIIKEEKDKAKDTKKEEQVEYEILKEWRSDDVKNSSKKRAQIPHVVTMTITLWDNQQEQERTYTFTYTIAGFAAELDRIMTPTKSVEQSKKPPVPNKNSQSRRPQMKSAQNSRLQLPSMEELKRIALEMVAMIDGG